LFKRNKNEEKPLQISTKEKDELLADIELKREELALLNAEKDDLLKSISSFELEYNRQLGKCLQRILVLRIEKAKLQVKGSPDNSAQYKEAVTDYENFNEKSHSLEEKRIFSLNEDDLKKLKLTFRKAARKCHPDVVADTNKEKSQAVFIALRQAYERNDLEEVLHIAEQLEQEKDINIPEIEAQEIKSLKRIRGSLERKLDDLNNEMIGIMSSETYQIITNEDDMEAYFDNLREQLKIQINALENNNNRN